VIARPDVFALGNAGLDAFLWGEVGTELNGSMLTILSALARLGFDPWLEAACWARLPRAAAIDRLAGLIAQMPLCPQSLDEARGTAVRLSRLLPGKTKASPSGERNSALPVIAVVSVTCVALVFALLLNNAASRGTAPKPGLHQQIEQKD
jgi:hypothetical protein